MFWTNLKDPEFTDTFLDIVLPFRIATFFITEWPIGAFIRGAVSVPEAGTLAISKIRGHQGLTILLSVDH